jgi:hypothetical protein
MDGFRLQAPPPKTPPMAATAWRFKLGVIRRRGRWK